MPARTHHDLLFEIGVEELPSGYVPPALEQFAAGARAALAAERLACTDVATYGTPRRLALHVSGLAARQSEFDEEAMGPAVRVAFDAEGQPTKALIGFCKGKGVEPSGVRRVATPKGEYVAVTVHHGGKPAADVLPGILAALASRLQFPKQMRWLADGDVRFARPVRWLVALLDDQVLPVRAFGLEAGRVSQGHRFLKRGDVTIPRARDYLKTLEATCVLADHGARGGRLSQQVEGLAREAGGRVVADPELLEINNFLVEWPTSFAGAFDQRYLELPREVIVTALREHQRFFAVEDAGGTLLPAFVAARNGDAQGLATVRSGNEHVLAARLADARFYWDTDLKRTPVEQVEALASVVWMEGLGSLRDKAARLESLTGWLAERLAPGAAAHASRAALLCKTDLLGEMIGSGKEYAVLEGVIGGHYARHAGEPEAVAVAIAEHYRPRGAAEALPETDAGAILSIADKLDHVAGAFVAGKVPSGSEDPYGVRRAANGVVRVLIERGWHLDFYATAMESTRILFANDPDLPHSAIMKQLGEFWRGRVETALDERGVAYDARDAACEARITLRASGAGATLAGAGVAAGPRRPGWCDPADCLMRARALAGFRTDTRFESLVILFKRVANILKAATEALPGAVDRARLAEAPEQALLEALEAARATTDPLWQRRAYGDILPAFLAMEHAIHDFFDHVLVNADDLTVRANRLKLLAEVRELFTRGWDLSKVVVEGETG